MDRYLYLIRSVGFLLARNILNLVEIGNQIKSKFALKCVSKVHFIYYNSIVVYIYTYNKIVVDQCLYMEDMQEKYYKIIWLLENKSYADS